MQTKRRYPALVPALAGLLALLLGLLPLLGRSPELSAAGGARQVEIIEKAVRRAAVECYALEGSYPPDLEYLTERYGLLLNDDRFFVDYQVTGSNLAPDIRVYYLGSGVDGDD